MLGIIKNNFYSVASSIKLIFGIFLLINLATIIFISSTNNFSININNFSIPSDTYFAILILAQVGAFVGLTATALQKDNACKWSKFERILPISIANTVKARYITFLLFSAMGLSLSLITLAINYFLQASSINLERIGYYYTFAIAFALLTPAILYPLCLKFGTDKSEIFLIISLSIVLPFFSWFGYLGENLLENVANSNLIYRLSLIIFAILTFITSYFIAKRISKNKEY